LRESSNPRLTPIDDNGAARTFSGYTSGHCKPLPRFVFTKLGEGRGGKRPQGLV